MKQWCITSENYINQILKSLDLPFFEKMVEKSGNMIWINNGAVYHISKFTAKFG